MSRLPSTLRPAAVRCGGAAAVVAASIGRKWPSGGHATPRNPVEAAVGLAWLRALRR